jgi:hypothetical protein
VAPFKSTLPLLRVGSERNDEETVRAGIDPYEIRCDYFPDAGPEYYRYPTCSVYATAVPAVCICAVGMVGRILLWTL